MNNKDNNMDRLLKRALGSTEHPDRKLIHKVKGEMFKEESNLKKATIRRSFSAVAAAVIVCLLIPTSAFAAWYFLSPAQVAQEFEYDVLAEAFESDDALTINQTQSDDGYDITLLGIVSGAGLTELDEMVDMSKTYAVVAIARQGDTMPAVSDAGYDGTPFFISPLIHGQKPWQFNAASMGGGYAACVKEGIMYRLIECDNIEMFADRGLSLIVSSTDFYSIEAFDYNEGTGLVTPKTDFDGVNVIFDLPLDADHADYEKAQEYLDTLWDENNARAEQASPVEQTPPVDPNAEIADDVKNAEYGTEQIMTRETMSAWIEKELAKTRQAIARGEYSEASMELDRQEYERYMQAIEEGKKVTLYTTKNGGYMFYVDPEVDGLEVNMTEEGFHFIYRGE